MRSENNSKEQPDVTYTLELVALVPELNELYKIHIDENEVLLPHVFFGDITRFIVAEVLRDKHNLAIARLLEEFEKSLHQGPKEVQDLIAASFIENLCGEKQALDLLRPAMRQELRSKLRTICGV